MCYTKCAMKQTDKKTALAELEKLYPDAICSLEYTDAGYGSVFVFALYFSLFLLRKDLFYLLV